MEEEFDLRPYIDLLLKRWYLIVGAAVLAGVVAFVVSSLMPRTYEATALVAITESRINVQFDTRIEELVEGRQSLNAYPELATSDQLLQELLAELNPSLEGVETLDDLHRILEAQPGSDPSLVRLSARYLEPTETAHLTNTWAELYVTKGKR